MNIVKCKQYLELQEFSWTKKSQMIHKNRTTHWWLPKNYGRKRSEDLKRKMEKSVL